MKKQILTILFLLFNLSIFAQTDSVFVWENYLPKSEVDSIVVLSTDTFEVKRSHEIIKMAMKEVKAKRKREKKIRDKRRLIEQSLKLHNEKAQRMLVYGKFDLNDYQEYVNHYEKQYSITDSSEIKRFVSLFYEKDDCTEVEQLMCIPAFREIVIFFKDGNPFFAMKICFGCHKIATTSPRDLECFKSSEAFENVIKEWERREWLKHRKKKYGRY